jgi:hypothetical protein
MYIYIYIYNDLLEGEGQVSLHTNKLLTEFKSQIFENRREALLLCSALIGSTCDTCILAAHVASASSAYPVAVV